MRSQLSFLSQLAALEGSTSAPLIQTLLSSSWLGVCFKEIWEHFWRSSEAGQSEMGKLEPHLWDVVIPPLPLLLLQFDGDAADRAPLDSLHQVGDIPAGTRGCPGLSRGSWHPSPHPKSQNHSRMRTVVTIHPGNIPPLTLASSHHLQRIRDKVSDSNRVWGRQRPPQTRENSRSPLPALSMTRPQAGP